MINIEKLKSTWYFEDLFLKKWDILFSEWDIDDNLYIVEDWELIVEKFTNSDKIETRELAKIWNNAIFWEWSLTNSNKKEVRIRANNDTKLVFINSKVNFEKFIVKNPSQGINLLAEIIDLTNKRLLDSNYMVTSSYSISKFISEISEFNNENLYKIFDELNSILKSEYVIYLENNPVMDKYLSMKYDTRYKWKMQNIIIEEWLDKEIINQLINEWVILGEKYILNEIVLAWKKIWLLLIGSEKLSDTIEKSLLSISISIGWYIKQKQKIEEDNNLYDN